ncbi:3'-to-5' oligoribonuclease [Enhygromyxa salina]|uniref:Oligoribonuclease n=1 Tax=Enhygromyxa salina TaxID=215803 RepID=A0A0C2D1B7_9BACT|nr:oligoribonuclease [Enhygromyxa salina]KIG15615.1 3'-to-5' oligoribonuclease [Enhygromyxa salina]
MADPHPPLIWIDMEMTGLDPDTEKVLEIATLITNADLELIAEGPELVIHQPDEVLDAMGEWCVEHHGASGLTELARASTLTVEEAERQTLAFVQAHCPPGQSPLCGNTIGQDRRFLVRHMPALERFFHYRSVDVTTLKELCQRWYPTLPGIAKAETHRALDDIRESIAELRYYREHMFVKTTAHAGA